MSVSASNFVSFIKFDKSKAHLVFIVENLQDVDILFYREIEIGVLSLDKEKMKKAYDMWYKDCMKQFWK